MQLVLLLAVACGMFYHRGSKQTATHPGTVVTTLTNCIFCHHYYFIIIIIIYSY